MALLAAQAASRAEAKRRQAPNEAHEGRSWPMTVCCRVYFGLKGCYEPLKSTMGSTWALSLGFLWGLGFFQTPWTLHTDARLRRRAPKVSSNGSRSTAESTCGSNPKIPRSTAMAPSCIPKVCIKTVQNLTKGRKVHCLTHSGGPGCGYLTKES